MLRVRLLLPRHDLAEAVRLLGKAGLLHPQCEEASGLGADSSLAEEVENCRRLQGILQSLATRLAVRAEARSPWPAIDLPGWEAWSAQVQARLDRLARRRRELEGLQFRLQTLELLLLQLRGVRGDAGRLPHLRFWRLRFGAGPMGLIDRLRALDPAVTATVLGRREGAALLAILFPQRLAAAIDDLLAGAHFAETAWPTGLRDTFPAALERIRRLRRLIEEHRRTLAARKEGVQREAAAELSRRLGAVHSLCRHLEARLSAGFSERLAVVGGWLPAARLAEAEALVQRAGEGRWLLHRVAAAGDETPVLLTNPAPIRPFQRLLAIYGTPVYGTLEPTPLLAVGFLVLFGMMFGDLGQGLVLVAVGLVLRRTRWREEGLLVAEVGVAAACFGILFGSIFGREDLIPALWFHPLEEIPRLMAAAMAIGVSLILLGLLLRVVGGMRRGGEGRAALLTDRYGAAGLVFYGGAVVTAWLVWRGSWPIVAALWLLLPLTAVFFHPFAAGEPGKGVGEKLAEGTVEVLETILVYLANTFSFLRVAAFGLAHVGLFLAIFALADQVRELPLGGFWVALVHVAGNLLMLTLEALVVTVQTVRLEFYEFFSKFFHGGGVPYRPLLLNGGKE